MEPSKTTQFQKHLLGFVNRNGNSYTPEIHHTGPSMAVVRYISVSMCAGQSPPPPPPPLGTTSYATRCRFPKLPTKCSHEAHLESGVLVAKLYGAIVSGDPRRTTGQGEHCHADSYRKAFRHDACVLTSTLSILDAGLDEIILHDVTLVT
jgi:hypothetical protein